MQYFKVPKELDGIPFKTYPIWLQFFKDELFTEKECIKYGINKKRLIPVNISKRRIYWFFGCRHEMKE